MAILSRVLTLFVLVIWTSVGYGGAMKDLRGKRYCEILLGNNLKEIHVYNTIGLNDCPADIWRLITPQKIKKQTNSLFAHLNGPRYWVIDEMSNTTLVDPQVRTITGLAMRDAGILHLSFIDFIRGQKPYLERTVSRHTTWVYHADQPIYELIDPQQRRFVMQAFSIQTTHQTLESLANLGTRLKLPAGWQFQVRVLQQPAYLTPFNQQAIIIQDDYMNTYQLETPAFNNGS